MFFAALLIATTVVQPGNTLSGIAASRGVSLSAVEQANPQISNPDLIVPGEVVHLSANASDGTVSHASSGSGSYGHPYRCGDGDGDGYDLPCSELHHSSPASSSSGSGSYSAPVHHSYSSSSYSSPSSTSSAYSGGSSFQRCVVSRESGGNAHAVNPSSGAGGLYQFLPSTWHALGHSGLPQNASVSEQNQAFQQEYAQGGTSAWSPSDHC